jgi:hypothetical protein
VLRTRVEEKYLKLRLRISVKDKAQGVGFKRLMRVTGKRLRLGIKKLGKWFGVL